MKNLGMIIFFSIVIVIYGLLNYYIIRRGLSVMEPGSSFRNYWIWGVIILASAFIIGRFLERTMINPLTITMIWIGSFWLGIMIYLFLQIAVIDIVRGLNHIIGFLPAFITSNPAKTKMILAIAVASITFLTALIGHINTWIPVTRKLDIEYY